MLGAVLLIISQVPLKGEYYDMIGTRSFSVGEPMTFYWTFEANATYRFEVKGEEWTSALGDLYVHYVTVGNDTNNSWALSRPTDPPWVWDWNHNQEATRMYNVTFWSYEASYYSNPAEIQRATTTSAFVEISQPRETAYRLTYLIYVGLPLVIISAIVIIITGKDVNSQTGLPDTSESH